VRGLAMGLCWIDRRITRISWSSRGLTRIASGIGCTPKGSRTVGEKPGDHDDAVPFSVAKNSRLLLVAVAPM